MESNKRRADSPEENEAKRMKTEANGESKVIHIRNLPENCSEPEVISLGAFYGRIEKCMLLPTKTQALLQMANLEDAKELIKSNNNNPAELRGKKIFMDFSRRQEITSGDQSGPSQNFQNKKVVHLSLEIPTLPPTLKAVLDICSQFGKVDKILIFNRATFQALVEFSTNSAAETCVQHLNNRRIFGDASYFRVTFSNTDTLTIRENGERSWDFTVADFIPNSPARHQPFMVPSAPLNESACSSNQNPSLGLNGESSVLFVRNINNAMLNIEDLFILFGNYGNVMRIKISHRQRDTALIQMDSNKGAATAKHHLHQFLLFGKNLNVNFSKMQEVKLSLKVPEDGSEPLTKDFSSSNLHRFRKVGSKNCENIYPPSRVLHISNIPESMDENDIMNIFRDKHFEVKKAKTITINDKRMVLLELITVEAAAIALIKCHNLRVDEHHHLRVSFSEGFI